MSDEADAAEPKKKSGAMGVLIALVLGLASAGGGFYALYSGMLFGPADKMAKVSTSEAEYEETGPVPSFVPLQPLMVTLGRGDVLESLRFEGYLEVRPGSEATVEQLMPRVMDVLNGYLRAVEIGDLSDPTALLTLRMQMLRRIQTVVGGGMVDDLLISKFLLT